MPGRAVQCAGSRTFVNERRQRGVGLDALPDAQLAGTVESIARSVRAKSEANPSKVIDIKATSLGVTYSGIRRDPETFAKLVRATWFAWRDA